MARPAFRYSRWDGTQVGFELDADTCSSRSPTTCSTTATSTRRCGGCCSRASSDREGNWVQGVRDLLDKLRRERQERLDRFDLGGVYDEIAQELREVVETERAALGPADERQMQLEMLPPDLAGMVRELQSYEFTSAEASSGSRSWSSGCASRCSTRTSTACPAPSRA